jgi:hypothetical protein
VAMLRCSSDSSPVAGGTETGNPDVTACVVMVFGALGDTSQWNVQSLVPGGIARLDSAGIMGGAVYSHPGGALSKQWTERQDTVVGSVHYITYTIFVDDTVLLTDTSVVYDTTIVNDTVAVVDTVSDTSRVVEQGDTTSIIVRHVKIRSVLVVDTVVASSTYIRTDTLFVLDTVVIRDTVDAADTSAAVRDTPVVVYSPVYRHSAGTATALRQEYVRIAFAMVTPDSASVNYVMLDQQGDTALVPVRPSSMRLVSEQATGLVTKSCSPAGGARVTETYGDLDGDGQLFGLGGQKMRLTHAYALGADSVDAAADIGSGADQSLNTTPDNTVLALLLQTRTGSWSEHVGYENASALAAGDSLSLTRLRIISDSSLEIFTQNYRLRRGANATAGNDDSLRGWSASAIYASGPVNRMDIEVNLDAAAARGRALSGAWSDVTIWFADGSVGVLDSARIDFAGGILSGVYRRDGKSYDISVDRSGNPAQ